MARNNLGKLHDAFMNADPQLTPEGNGGFSMNDSTLMPTKPSGGKGRSLQPQSPAQHNAVEKAAKASVMNRRSRAIKPMKGL